MTTPPISIVYFIVAALVGALGQYFYKAGADQAGDSFASYLNLRILAGVVCYVAVMVLFVAGAGMASSSRRTSIRLPHAENVKPRTRRSNPRVFLI